MKIYEVENEPSKEELLTYLEEVPWGAAKMLREALVTDTVREKMGPDARVFYAKMNGEVMGFFTLVNQDYIPLPQYDRFIAMAWVDPWYRRRGYAREFIRYAEEASGVATIHIVTQHKGLYEKMGYTLEETFTGTLHGTDYLYRKRLI